MAKKTLRNKLKDEFIPTWVAPRKILFKEIFFIIFRADSPLRFNP